MEWCCLERAGNEMSIFFDTRVCCVTPGAAGGYYAKLQQLANGARVKSQGKITISLAGVADGLIIIRINPAIKDATIDVEQLTDNIKMILRDALTI